MKFGFSVICDGKIYEAGKEIPLTDGKEVRPTVDSDFVKDKKPKKVEDEILIK